MSGVQCRQNVCVVMLWIQSDDVADEENSIMCAETLVRKLQVYLEIGEHFIHLLDVDELPTEQVIDREDSRVMETSSR